MIIDKKDVIDYFNAHASSWDSELIKNEGIVELILDYAGISRGARVLDVACGTGVLIPNYLGRNVSSVTGVDISPEMIRAAAAKFPQSNVSFICADAERDDIGKDYSNIMIYNAFPHFPNPEKLIEKLSSLLVPGGTLTVAHGMSRAKIDAHHSGSAHSVSMGLMPEAELAELFSKQLSVSSVISNGDMYLVSGCRL